MGEKTHYIKGTRSPQGLSLMALTLIARLNRWLSGFPTVKLLLTPSLSYCLEGNDHAQSTLKGGGIHINHLEFICMGGLPVLSHLFIQYHFYQCGLLGIYYIVLFITQYYFTLPGFGPTPE